MSPSPTPPPPSPTATHIPASPTSAAVTASPAAAPTDIPTPSPVVLRLAYSRGWTQLDPYATTAPEFFSFFSNVYSGLLRYRTGPEQGAMAHEVTLDLAETWEQPNPTTYVFHLRPDARWQDVPPVNGRRVTAGDVVESVRRLAADSAHAWAWAKLEEVYARDDATVVMVTTEPFAPFLSYVASGFNVIVPQEVWELTGGDLKSGPALGSGPFIFLPEDSDRTRRAVFRRNPDFYEAGSNVDAVEAWIIGNAPTRLALVETGQIDVASLPWSEVAALEEFSHEGVVVDVARRPATWFLGLHNSYPLNDRHIRQAISLAIDRHGILRDYFGGADLLGLGMPVPSAEALLSPEEVRAALRYDPGEARGLLDRALLFGQTLSVELLVGEFGEVSLNVGERIARDLRAVGIGVDVRVATPSRYTATALAAPGVFQMAFGPSRAYFSADQWLTSRFHSQGAANGSGVDDMELDSMIGSQREELDPVRRSELLRDAQRRILAEYYGPPLYEDAKWVVRRDWVQGWSSFPDYPYGRFLRYVQIDGFP